MRRRDRQRQDPGLPAAAAGRAALPPGGAGGGGSVAGVAPRAGGAAVAGAGGAGRGGGGGAVPAGGAAGARADGRRRRGRAAEAAAGGAAGDRRAAGHPRGAAGGAAAAVPGPGAAALDRAGRGGHADGRVLRGAAGGDPGTRAPGRWRPRAGRTRRGEDPGGGGRRHLPRGAEPDVGEVHRRGPVRHPQHPELAPPATPHPAEVCPPERPGQAARAAAATQGAPGVWWGCSHLLQQCQHCQLAGLYPG